jgi:NAD(P)-dependent dehydrogenase (short-subunit alcohol dehydrogenase family)
MPHRRGAPLGCDVCSALRHRSDIPGGNHHRVRDFVVTPRRGTANLTAMLAAVEALAPALALEPAPVRLNAVTPGFTDTPRLHTAYAI